MKHFLLLITFLSISCSFAQTFDTDLSTLVEAEAKAASNRMYNHKVNMNTGNYNVLYHKLDLMVDPSVAAISGTVTTHFEAKEYMNDVTFDLADNMIVSQVLQNGNALTYIQNTNDELVITLQQALNIGQIGIVEITYSGNPVSSGFGSFAQTTHNGDPIIWTLSEPYGAKGWWPCKQDLNDKIDSIDVYLTTPQFNADNEEYIAVSNGVEQSQTVVGFNKTTHYKHQFPIPAYLVAIAATNYEVYSHTVPNNGNSFDIVNYVYPESLTSAQTSTGITVNIMELFSNRFEEYPYASEKYGHAQFGWGGGMEHTTVSFMGNFSRNLIAHELAHQWFGNKITCGSWKDIWLNEGFATYLSGLVIEDFDGNNSFTSWKQSRVNSITSQPDGSVYLTDADTTSVNRIFSSRLSYNKGAMVLHMLRKKLGETNFYQGMQDYLSDPNLAFNYAKTPDYIAKMEAVSGENLTDFFNNWIYNQGYPSYTITANWANANQLQIHVNQTQSHSSVSYFKVPIPLRIVGTNGEQLDVVLNNTFQGETFLETVNFPVSQIIFDPEVDIISKNNNITLSTNIFDISGSLLMYPNPTSSFIIIEKPEYVTINAIQMFDVLGRLVLETNYQENINTKNLSSGLHFVKFYTNQGVFHKRLLKE